MLCNLMRHYINRSTGSRPSTSEVTVNSELWTQKFSVCSSLPTTSTEIGKHNTVCLSLSNKMANQPTPVEACTGWGTKCPFCDKRFSEWIESGEDEDIQKIPTTPGAYMFAFDSKHKREIVSIGVTKSNIQTLIVHTLEDLKKTISQKKFKETKSSILLRWMSFPKVDTKEVGSIIAHWHNFGTVPRLTKNWPGLDLLENNPEFTYSELSKKWCYPLKDPVWRKPKAVAPVKAVPKCKGWNSTCAYCDSHFTSWVPIREALNKKEDCSSAPSQQGVCMISAVSQGKRQVVQINSFSDIKYHIRSASHYVEYALKNSGKFDSTSEIEVRWMTVKDLEEADACFVYAHFLNYRETPLLNQELPGEEFLHKSEQFVFRHRDQQWCYQEEKAAVQTRVNKKKDRRDVLNSMLEELQDPEST